MKMQQSEKKGFSKREKRLILFMGIVGFTALMVMYVILPFYENLQNENDRYNALVLEQMQLQALLNSAQSIRDNHTATTEAFYEARARFLNESHISVIGRMLTNLLLDHNLGAPNQSLTLPIIPTDWDAFMTMTASMTALGEYEYFLDLLDTVFYTEYLRITRLSFNLQPDQATNSFALNFEIIMMQDLE
jgi:predicted PurR-regulated permease PerM